MKLALRQRHGVTDEAITAIAVQDDAAPTFRVTRLRREWLRDRTIENTVGHQCVATIGYTARYKCCLHSHDEPYRHGVNPPPNAARRLP